MAMANVEPDPGDYILEGFRKTLELKMKAEGEAQKKKICGAIDEIVAQEIAALAINIHKWVEIRSYQDRLVIEVVRREK